MKRILMISVPLVMVLALFLNFNPTKDQTVTIKENKNCKPPPSCRVSKANAAAQPFQTVNEIIKSYQVGPAYANSTPVAHFVRRILEDSKGQMWMGTQMYGVAVYNGREIQYYNKTNQLIGNQVRAIVEDSNSHVWVATENGISRYNGKYFVHYGTAEGLLHPSVWSLFVDAAGTLWAGTNEGLCIWKGDGFTAFNLPKFKVENPNPRFSTQLVRCMFQDTKGNMWWGMDGLGLIKREGKTFKHYGKFEGLTDLNVTCIKEDNKGRMWIGTSFGGILCLVNDMFTAYNTNNVLGNDEVWEILCDRSGKVWCSSEGYGVYVFEGDNCTQMYKDKGLEIGAVQSIYQDRDDRIWVGGYGGLFRYLDGEFIHVSKHGPWDDC